ncbi:DNA damage-regulated autophagy modulator protein 2-like isoform X1 [Ostrea edulis]|uniref:DNA damage-regulated autophagy modulator protein 2-like isoform X1 n=2 Tax=Ostrea edulis TaxID=37623 RepID=UPI0024AFDC86|nr:DNA damage-regulated autophagy modulator protein 2-like isoform X1 [Ostrea edulis]
MSEEEEAKPLRATEECPAPDTSTPDPQRLPGVMSLACLVFLRRRLYLLPLITALWIIMAFFISYGISIKSGSVKPEDFPYISYTAIEAPERCVFGQLINIGAVLLGMNVWVRYLFVKEIFQKRKVKDVTYWQKVNIAGIILGFLSALGISMVANFQTVVQRGPHYVGAGLAFGLGLAYCWLQTRLSWKLRSEKYGHRLVAVTQLINSTALTVFLILFSITKIIYKLNEAKDLKKGLKDTKFTSLRGVYLASTISEWLVATSVLTFALTFIWDFRALVMETPRVNVNFNMIENGGTKASSQKAKEGTDDTNMNSINVRA